MESYGQKIAEEMEKLNQLETEENKGYVRGWCVGVEWGGV